MIWIIKLVYFFKTCSLLYQFFKILLTLLSRLNHKNQFLLIHKHFQIKTYKVLRLFRKCFELFFDLEYFIYQIIKYYINLNHFVFIKNLKFILFLNYLFILTI